MNPVDNHYSSRAEYFEALEAIPTNPSADATFGDVINARFNRRALLKGALGVTALGGPGCIAAGGAISQCGQ